MKINRLNDKRGATLILVAILMTALLGFAALAIDIGNLVMVKNQLQNAADASALAGAAELYNATGTAINEGANFAAFTIATSNRASSVLGEIAVESSWAENSGDIQRGHWSFATRTFTPNDSLEPTELWGKTTEELDLDTTFVNAVRAVVRREETPISSFFAGLFGFQDFAASAEAVAYIGFAGQLDPGDADQPIAICMESILQDDMYTCNIGRMINSGQNVESNETGGWTSFNQDNPCQGGTNAQEVRSLVCASGNTGTVNLGSPVATVGGQLQSAFSDLYDCWAANTDKTTSWNLTLPVVTCPGNNVGTCQEVVGAVNLNIVWINEQNDPNFLNTPTQMDDWSFPADAGNTNGEQRWASFVDHFNLQNVDGTPAPYQNKAIYFKPDCTPHELKGRTGGSNFGVLARIPVLVN